jgi:class 3 adenylate cyclase
MPEKGASSAGMDRPARLEDFAPEIVLRLLRARIAPDGSFPPPPHMLEFDSVFVFVDVAGFTTISESFAKKGTVGAEKLWLWLSEYFGKLVATITRAGGDVYKFAGDALMIVWPPAVGAASDDDEPSAKGAAPSPFLSAVSRARRPRQPRVSQTTEGIDATTRRAVRCALSIQKQLQGLRSEEGHKFQVKIGVGTGRMALYLLGGVFDRLEYTCVGPALAQAFECEEVCLPGEVIVSKQVWSLVSQYFDGDPRFSKPGATFQVKDHHAGPASMTEAEGESSTAEDGLVSPILANASQPEGSTVEPSPQGRARFWHIKASKFGSRSPRPAGGLKGMFSKGAAKEDPGQYFDDEDDEDEEAGPDSAREQTTAIAGVSLKVVSRLKLAVRRLRRTNLGAHSPMLKRLTPAAILPQLELPHITADWAAELRTISVLFISLGLAAAELQEDPSDDMLRRMHMAVRAVQESIYLYEGSVNKFLMDDKGATVLAVFGLAPLAHTNDPERAVLSALQVAGRLRALGLRPKIGVTSGVALCGPLGGGSRREYSVLGDVVNTAARLMAAAGKHAPADDPKLPLPVSIISTPTETEAARLSESIREEKAQLVRNRFFPSDILIDEPTKLSAMSNNTLLFQPIVPLTLKGKRTTVSVWQPGMSGESNVALSMLWRPGTALVALGEGGPDDAIAAAAATITGTGEGLLGHPSLRLQVVRARTTARFKAMMHRQRQSSRVSSGNGISPRAKQDVPSEAVVESKLPEEVVTTTSSGAKVPFKASPFAGMGVIDLGRKKPQSRSANNIGDSSPSPAAPPKDDVSSTLYTNPRSSITTLNSDADLVSTGHIQPSVAPSHVKRNSNDSVPQVALEDLPDVVQADGPGMDTLEEAAAQERVGWKPMFLLIGEPGSGKTSILQAVAWTCVADLGAETAFPLPSSEERTNIGPQIYLQSLSKSTGVFDPHWLPPTELRGALMSMASVGSPGRNLSPTVRTSAPRTDEQQSLHRSHSSPRNTPESAEDTPMVTDFPSQPLPRTKSLIPESQGGISRRGASSSSTESSPVPEAQRGIAVLPSSVIVHSRHPHIGGLRGRSEGRQARGSMLPPKVGLGHDVDTLTSPSGAARASSLLITAEAGPRASLGSADASIAAVRAASGVDQRMAMEDPEDAQRIQSLTPWKGYRLHPAIDLAVRTCGPSLPHYAVHSALQRAAKNLIATGLLSTYGTAKAEVALSAVKTELASEIDLALDDRAKAPYLVPSGPCGALISNPLPPPLRVLYACGTTHVEHNPQTYVWRQIIHQLVEGWPRCFSPVSTPEISMMLAEIRQHGLFSDTATPTQFSVGGSTSPSEKPRGRTKQLHMPPHVKVQREDEIAWRLIALHSRWVPIVILLDDMHLAKGRDWEITAAVARRLAGVEARGAPAGFRPWKGTTTKPSSSSTPSAGVFGEPETTDHEWARTKCVMCVTALPLHRIHHRPIFTAPPSGYFELLALGSCSLVEAHSLTSDDAQDAIARVLKVENDQVPPQLLHAAYTMSAGNPRGVKQLVKALKERRHLRVHSRPDHAKSKHRIPAPEKYLKVDLGGLALLPLPYEADRVSAAALDRLPPSAVVLAKAAAVLAVGGGTTCLYCHVPMLLDTHPAVAGRELMSRRVRRASEVPMAEMSRMLEDSLPSSARGSDNHHEDDDDDDISGLVALVTKTTEATPGNTQQALAGLDEASPSDSSTEQPMLRGDTFRVNKVVKRFPSEAAILGSRKPTGGILTDESMEDVTRTSPSQSRARRGRSASTGAVTAADLMPASWHKKNKQKGWALRLPAYALEKAGESAGFSLEAGLRALLDFGLVKLVRCEAPLPEGDPEGIGARLRETTGGGFAWAPPDAPVEVSSNRPPEIAVATIFSETKEGSILASARSESTRSKMDYVALGEFDAMFASSHSTAGGPWTSDSSLGGASETDEESSVVSHSRESGGHSPLHARPPGSFVIPASEKAAESLSKRSVAPSPPSKPRAPSRPRNTLDAEESPDAQPNRQLKGAAGDSTKDLKTVTSLSALDIPETPDKVKPAPSPTSAEKVHPKRAEARQRIRHIRNGLNALWGLQAMSRRREDIVLAFTSGFVRDAIYHRVLHKHRERLHRSAADVIASMPPDAAPPFLRRERDRAKHFYRHLVFSERKEEAELVFERFFTEKGKEARELEKRYARPSNTSEATSGYVGVKSIQAESRFGEHDTRHGSVHGSLPMSEVGGGDMTDPNLPHPPSATATPADKGHIAVRRIGSAPRMTQGRKPFSGTQDIPRFRQVSAEPNGPPSHPDGGVPVAVGDLLLQPDLLGLGAAMDARADNAASSRSRGTPRRSSSTSPSRKREDLDEEVIVAHSGWAKSLLGKTLDDSVLHERRCQKLLKQLQLAMIAADATAAAAAGLFSPREQQQPPHHARKQSFDTAAVSKLSSIEESDSGTADRESVLAAQTPMSPQKSAASRFIQREGISIDPTSRSSATGATGLHVLDTPLPNADQDSPFSPTGTDNRRGSVVTSLPLLRVKSQITNQTREAIQTGLAEMRIANRMDAEDALQDVEDVQSVEDADGDSTDSDGKRRVAGARGPSAASGEDKFAGIDIPPDGDDGASPQKPGSILLRPRQTTASHQPDVTPVATGYRRIGIQGSGVSDTIDEARQARKFVSPASTPASTLPQRRTVASGPTVSKSDTVATESHVVMEDHASQPVMPRNRRSSLVTKLQPGRPQPPTRPNNSRPVPDTSPLNTASRVLSPPDDHVGGRVMPAATPSQANWPSAVNPSFGMSLHIEHGRPGGYGSEPSPFDPLRNPADGFGGTQPAILLRDVGETPVSGRGGPGFEIMSAVAERPRRVPTDAPSQPSVVGVAQHLLQPIPAVESEEQPTVKTVQVSASPSHLPADEDVAPPPKKGFLASLCGCFGKAKVVPASRPRQIDDRQSPQPPPPVPMLPDGSFATPSHGSDGHDTEGHGGDDHLARGWATAHGSAGRLPETFTSDEDGHSRRSSIESDQPLENAAFNEARHRRESGSITKPINGFSTGVDGPDAVRHRVATGARPFNTADVDNGDVGLTQGSSEEDEDGPTTDVTGLEEGKVLGSMDSEGGQPHRIKRGPSEKLGSKRTSSGPADEQLLDDHANMTFSLGRDFAAPSSSLLDKQKGGKDTMGGLQLSFEQLLAQGAKPVARQRDSHHRQSFLVGKFTPHDQGRIESPFNKRSTHKHVDGSNTAREPPTQIDRRNEDHDLESYTFEGGSVDSDGGDDSARGGNWVPKIGSGPSFRPHEDSPSTARDERHSSITSMDFPPAEEGVSVRGGDRSRGTVMPAGRRVSEVMTPGMLLPGARGTLVKPKRQRPSPIDLDQLARPSGGEEPTSKTEPSPVGAWRTQQLLRANIERETAIVASGDGHADSSLRRALVGESDDHFLRAMSRVDAWDFDALAVDRFTGGRPLLPVFSTISRYWEFSQRLNIPGGALIAGVRSLESLQPSTQSLLAGSVRRLFGIKMGQSIDSRWRQSDVWAQVNDWSKSGSDPGVISLLLPRWARGHRSSLATLASPMGDSPGSWNVSQFATTAADGGPAEPYDGRPAEFGGLPGWDNIDSVISAKPPPWAVGAAGVCPDRWPLAYHNAAKAADAVQAVHLVLHSAELRPVQMLFPLEVAALLMAAAAHTIPLSSRKWPRTPSALARSGVAGVVGAASDGGSSKIPFAAGVKRAPTYAHLKHVASQVLPVGIVAEAQAVANERRRAKSKRILQQSMASISEDGQEPEANMSNGSLLGGAETAQADGAEGNPSSTKDARRPSLAESIDSSSPMALIAALATDPILDGGDFPVAAVALALRQSGVVEAFDRSVAIPSPATDEAQPGPPLRPAATTSSKPAPSRWHHRSGSATPALGSALREDAHRKPAATGSWKTDTFSPLTGRDSQAPPVEAVAHAVLPLARSRGEQFVRTVIRMILESGARPSTAVDAGGVRRHARLKVRLAAMADAASNRMASRVMRRIRRRNRDLHGIPLSARSPPSAAKSASKQASNATTPAASSPPKTSPRRPDNKFVRAAVTARVAARLSNQAGMSQRPRMQMEAEALGLSVGAAWMTGLTAAALRGDLASQGDPLLLSALGLSVIGAVLPSGAAALSAASASRPSNTWTGGLGRSASARQEAGTESLVAVGEAAARDGPAMTPGMINGVWGSASLRDVPELLARPARRRALWGGLLCIASSAEVARPVAIGREWAARLAREMAAEGRAARSIGRSAPPYCDGAAPRVGEYQLRIRAEVCGPILRELVRLAPSLWDECVGYFEEGARTWASLKRLRTAKKAADGSVEKAAPGDGPVVGVQVFGDATAAGGIPLASRRVRILGHTGDVMMSARSEPDDNDIIDGDVKTGSSNAEQEPLSEAQAEAALRSAVAKTEGTLRNSTVSRGLFPIADQPDGDEEEEDDDDEEEEDEQDEDRVRAEEAEQLLAIQ